VVVRFFKEENYQQPRFFKRDSVFKVGVSPNTTDGPLYLQGRGLTD